MKKLILFTSLILLFATCKKEPAQPTPTSNPPQIGATIKVVVDSKLDSVLITTYLLPDGSWTIIRIDSSLTEIVFNNCQQTGDLRNAQCMTYPGNDSLQVRVYINGNLVGADTNWNYAAVGFTW